jgi:chorismate mutase-like protein
MQILNKLREEIDTIDASLLEALAKRRSLVAKIGQYKKDQGIPIVDKNRETEKLQLLTKKGEALGIPSALISQIWKILYNDAYTIEQ